MNHIIVTGNTLTFNGTTYPCAIGKNGFARDKKEGDGCTPIGIFALRECWYRADRLPAPHTQLPRRIITENDGWCDDPVSAEYNRHIQVSGIGYQVSEKKIHLSPDTRHPTPSFENLHRDDHVYDLIIPLGYNDDPVVPGKGSAIFMHLAHENYRGTEGCIALNKADLLDILLHCDTKTLIEIRS